MKVMHVCTEFFPLLKTGGLADVSGALPLAQQQSDIDVRLLMPGFPALLAGVTDIQTIAECHTFAGPVTLLLAKYQTLPIYLIDAPDLFQREGGPYNDKNSIDFADNYLRFAVFGWIACQLAKGLDPEWQPDIVHAHDWHAGLACAYLAADNYPAKCLFTIHNLAYQGVFPADCLQQLQLPDEFFSVQGLEFYGQISYLKAGIFYAHHVTTVSPTYANEITQEEYGCGLDGLLRDRLAQGRLSGILNAIDENVWDPAIDMLLQFNYSEQKLAGKQKNKIHLQNELGLIPEAKTLLFAAVSRLTSQKGLDLLLQTLPRIPETDSQFILLGNGDADLERDFQALADQYPDRIKVILGYNENLSHRIMAAADVIMVPSRFEPCGLTQLYALKYGALPLVRATGGLVDTVDDCSLENIADGSASGFVFQNSHPDDLDRAIRRAFALWQRPKTWREIQRNNMRQNRSWLAPAADYSALYQRLLHTDEVN